MNRNALIIGVLTIGLVLSGVARLTLSSEQTIEASSVAEPSKPERFTLDTKALDELVAPPIRISDSSPGVSARAAYLVDVSSGYPLYEENEREPVPIASTTKLMTAAIVVESYQLSDVVNISPTAASAIGSEIQLVADENITVEALLKALLIQSGNDAALALAEHMGLEAFIAAMNEKAVQLGLTDTHFLDPAGLDDGGRSSARDLAIIAAYILRHPAIAGIVRLPEATLHSVDGRYEHRVKNSNRLIQPDSPFFLSEATGLKTGFTPDAGHCLVASAEKGSHTIVSVILGTNEQTNEASAKESKRLLRWGFDAYTWE